MTYYLALAKRNLGSSEYLGMPQLNEIRFSWQDRLNRFILNPAVHMWLGQVTSRGPFQPQLPYKPIKFR